MELSMSSTTQPDMQKSDESLKNTSKTTFSATILVSQTPAVAEM